MKLTVASFAISLVAISISILHTRDAYVESKGQTSIRQKIWGQPVVFTNATGIHTNLVIK